MSILSKALHKPKSRMQPVIVNSTVTPQTLPELVTTMGMTTGSGQVVTPENSKNIATAYRCGNIISDDVAKMPLQTFISRQPGVTERMRPDGFTYNIAWRLERQPNRWWTPFWFKKVSIQWLLYWGNNYIWQPPSYTRELFILPANVSYPVFDRNGELWYCTTFRGESKQSYIPAVEIMHTLINPDATGFNGRGIIQYARETLGRQMAGYRSQNSLFKNGLSAAGILWLAGESSPEMREKVRNMYGEVMEGPDNTGRIAVLDKKVSKFEPVTMQPRDVQFLESLRDNDIAIMNFFGMPSYKLNIGKQSYQSNDQNNLDYLSTTLDPYLVQFEEAGGSKWLSTEEQAYTYLRWERSALYRTDAKSRGEYLNGAINNGRLSPNEARQIEDRTKSDNPAADLLYMNSGIQPIGGNRSQP